MDGYSSHTGDSRIDLGTLFTDNNIVVLTLPPHTTHVLQPLDVGVFNVFKANLRAGITRRAVKWLQDVEGIRPAPKKRVVALAKSIAA